MAGGPDRGAGGCDTGFGQRDTQQAHLIRARGEMIYVAPGLEEEYPNIDIDRLVMIYEDYTFVDNVDVVGDYMKGES